MWIFWMEWKQKQKFQKYLNNNILHKNKVNQKTHLPNALLPKFLAAQRANELSLAEKTINSFYLNLEQCKYKNVQYVSKKITFASLVWLNPIVYRLLQ